jgi:hypothetical protein
MYSYPVSKSEFEISQIRITFNSSLKSAYPIYEYTIEFEAVLAR